MDSDLTVIQWIESLPSSPSLFTMDASISKIRTRSQSKRTQDEDRSDSSKKPRNADSDRMGQIQQPPPQPTTPTLQLRKIDSPQSNRDTRRSSMSGRNSFANTPEKSTKQSQQQTYDWKWLKISKPKALFVDSLDEDSSPPTATQEAVKLARDLIQAASKGQYKGDATELAKIAREMREARHLHNAETQWCSLLRDLLKVAIGERGLKVVPVEDDSLDETYLPKWVNKEMIETGGLLNRKIDFVVTFPSTVYKELELATSASFGPFRNPFKRDSLNEDFVGLGIEVKDNDGSASVAEGQLGVWCATYFKWLYVHRTSDIPLPPIVACTTVGVTFNFFIAYAIEDPITEAFNVEIWGPHIELRALLDSKAGVIRAVSILQALFDYLEEDFIKQILLLRP